MLPSTLVIMSPMYLQNLKLPHPTVKRRCIYKKVHYLTLTLVSTTHIMLPSTPDPQYVTYAPAKFEAATSNGLGGYAFTRKYII